MRHRRFTAKEIVSHYPVHRPGALSRRGKARFA